MLLADYDLNVAIFEKQTAVYPYPRAIHLDDETLRIFQAMGGVEELQSCITPFEEMQFIGSDGRLLLQVAVGDATKAYGHHSSYWFYQPDLEAILRKKITEHKHIDLFSGYEVDALSQSPSGCSIKAKAIDKAEWIQCKGGYLVGCDGGKSIVRRSLGIALESLDFDQRWIVIDTLLKTELSDSDSDPLSTYHQQICDRKRPATYVPAVGKHRRFEFMLKKEETELELLDSEKQRALLSTFISPDRLEIIRASVYTYHALSAEQWKSGRCFLAGDAAHQMPPFAGQGMCSGIRDAHNLAFKLNLVIKGKKDAQLLDSYEQERKSHVRGISKGAIFLGKLIQTQHPLLAKLRDFQFFLARHFALIKELMRKDAIQKQPYQQGFFTEKHRLCGQLMIQPFVQKSNDAPTLLDTYIGNHFALIFIDAYDNTILERFVSDFNPVHLDFSEQGPFTSEVLVAWMRKHRLNYVLLRPDRYIFDAG